jgi:hypothetical protein
VTCRWFSPDSPVSSTNKTDCHDITEILLKVALNTINQTKPIKLVIIVNIKVLPTDDIVSKHISQIYLIAFMCVVNINFQ